MFKTFVSLLSGHASCFTPYVAIRRNLEHFKVILLVTVSELDVQWHSGTVAQ